MILGEDVHKFEMTNDLFGRVAGGAWLGGGGDYDWAGMNVEITRRVFEEGLPKSQGEWIRELQDWFSMQSEDGTFPDEKSIRLRLAPILKALKFKHPKRLEGSCRCVGHRPAGAGHCARGGALV